MTAQYSGVDTGEDLLLTRGEAGVDGDNVCGAWIQTLSGQTGREMIVELVGKAFVYDAQDLHIPVGKVRLPLVAVEEKTRVFNAAAADDHPSAMV